MSILDKPQLGLILACVMNVLIVMMEMGFYLVSPAWWHVGLAFINAVTAWYCWLVYRRIKKGEDIDPLWPRQGQWRRDRGLGGSSDPGSS